MLEDISWTFKDKSVITESHTYFKNDWKFENLTKNIVIFNC
jgi:hypothetical protein